MDPKKVKMAIGLMLRCCWHFSGWTIERGFCERFKVKGSKSEFCLFFLGGWVKSVWWNPFHVRKRKESAGP